MSDFEDWFVAQFGARPSRESSSDLLLEVNRRRVRLSSAEALLRQVLIWDEQHRAALYARNKYGPSED